MILVQMLLLVLSMESITGTLWCTPVIPVARQ